MNSNRPFSELNLPADMQQNLASLNYLNMTDIQAVSLPVILERKDVIAQAKTGSGKTAAFGIALLLKLNPALLAIQGIVICPTRELADQVAVSLRQLARHIENVRILTLCGGSPMGPQRAALEHGAHIIVGTPGRLRDHLGRHTLDLSRVHTVVLDEADRMVDMGFYEDMIGILSACPPRTRRQTLLFSATYPNNIKKIAADLMNKPERVTVAEQHSKSHLEQRYYEITSDKRNAAVAQLLGHYQPASALIFCNTKIHCQELADDLSAQGFSAMALYGDLDQRDRDEIIAQFSNQSCRILVATDVAARGLDIANLGLVINADVSRDAEVHVHRSGRTGRAEAKGLVLNLATAAERRWVAQIEVYQNQEADWYRLSDLPTAFAKPQAAEFCTLSLMGGKKDKLRAGDILGALTGDLSLQKEQVGKITVLENKTLVAIERHVAGKRFLNLTHLMVKGRQFKLRFL
jgi:ATP-independent RNA helicase DbpA